MSHAEASPGRHIGLSGATVIGLGAIVGGGVLALAGVAFGETGPSALLAFLLNGVIAFLTALAYAEMSSAFPENGGSYTFTKKVLSVQAAFGVGWILLFASVAAGVLYALGFAAYGLEATAEIWRLIAGTSPAWLRGRTALVVVAGAAIGFYTLILTRRHGGTGRAETIGKLVVFAVIIVGGIWVFLDDPAAATEGKLEPFFAGGPLGLVAAMGCTFIALQGFDIIAAVAGEVRDPARTLPRAMIGSLAVALIVYLPLLFVILTVGVPHGGSVTQMGRARPETMVAEAVGNFLGPTGFWLVMVAALLSMVSALFANLLAASRIVYAMAGDRTLPRMFATESKATGIPVRAVLAGAILMVLMLLAVPNVGAAGAAASLIFLISFALTHVTNIMARRRMGPGFGSFRVPWFPVLQTIGAVCCGGLAIFQSLAVPSAGSIAAVWLLGGFVLYFTSLASRATVVDARSQALDPELVRLRGRDPLVLVPLANPLRARSLVEVAEALTPPRVGRVLLLSILSPDGSWSELAVPPDLVASQEVMREAIREAVQGGVYPEAMTTIAVDRWAEIVRVAATRRCETLLLGLSDLGADTQRLPVEQVIAEVDSDVVVLGAPEGWRLRDVRRVLVPVAGGGSHDRLRARLLGGLGRSGDRRIDYLRVVPTTTSARDLRRMRVRLRRAAEEEAAAGALASVVASDDFLSVVMARAAESDLVVVGTQRDGRRRAIGRVALAIARATPGGIVLIGYRATATPLTGL